MQCKQNAKTSFGFKQYTTLTKLFFPVVFVSILIGSWTMRIESTLFCVWMFPSWIRDSSRRNVSYDLTKQKRIIQVYLLFLIVFRINDCEKVKMNLKLLCELVFRLGERLRTELKKNIFQNETFTTIYADHSSSIWNREWSKVKDFNERPR